MEINNNSLEPVAVPIPNREVGNKIIKKKQGWVLVVLLVLLVLTAIICGYFYFKNNSKKIIIPINPISQNTETQNDVLILPKDFPKEYIPISYDRLTWVNGYPPKDNKPYALILSVNRLLSDVYASAKQYYTDKGWQIAEVRDPKTKELKNIFSATSGENTVYMTFDLDSVSSTRAGTLVTLTVISNKK